MNSCELVGSCVVITSGTYFKTDWNSVRSLVLSLNVLNEIENEVDVEILETITGRVKKDDMYGVICSFHMR